ncbi:MAG: hypothetical protein MH321_03095 [Leptospiraceae bacterium]|nr:hypothetical protein [Leptospiraceae bacterium]
MKKIVVLIFLCGLYACDTNSLKTKEISKELHKYSGYYFMDDQLKRLGNYSIPNKDSIWFARLDISNSRVELIDGNSWKIVKILELIPYKEKVFYINGFDNLFLYLRIVHDNDKGQHGLNFISDKDNVQKYITGGYFVYDIKSIEDCKRYLKDWKGEAEETNCKDCYGPP